MSTSNTLIIDRIVEKTDQAQARVVALRVGAGHASADPIGTPEALFRPGDPHSRENPRRPKE